MKQKILITALLLAVFYGGFKLFQSPEKYLIKKTKRLISLGSQMDKSIGLPLSMTVSEISKSIHYDLNFKAEYDGQLYQVRSLKEFRSLLFLYFKEGKTQKLEYENMTVELKDEKIGDVSFFITFYNIDKVWSCEVLLNWIKEERWFIKNISIEKCKIV